MRFAKAAAFFSWNRSTFEFANPGPLVDAELELVAPSADRIDAVLAACEPGPNAAVIRRQLLEFVTAFPDGHQKGDSAAGVAPTYHFWMQVKDTPLPIVGGIGLRIGNTYDMVMYYGQVGYHVYSHARGRRYALRACRLLLPLALRHGLDPLWITCNPDNFASRRTCELLGAKLVETVPVPENHPLFMRGDLQKCRYRVDLRPRAAQ